MTENNAAQAAMQKLKPCPFCGGSVELEHTVGDRSWWGVICRNTGNRGGTCAVQILPSASKEAAIERWNMRAPVADSTMPIEKALYELVNKIAPGLDTGDLVQDARRASNLLGVIMASAPVAGEAQPVACGERVYAFRRKGLDDFVTCSQERFEELQAKPRLFETRIFYASPEGTGNVQPVAWMVDWPDEPDLGHTLLEDPVPGARNRALVLRDAAPQASEAVRKPITTLAEFCAEADRIGMTGHTLAALLAERPEFADCLPQADKDGGDCAKGAGDAMAIHPEIQAVLAMLDVPVLGYLGSHSGKLIKSSDKVDSFESAVPLVSETAHRAACEKIIVALSPTPAVVKQSLTATQTGEKGESE